MRGSGIPRVVEGLAMVDDEGDEVTVAGIDRARGRVTLQTDDDDGYSISLRELRGKLRDGEFAAIIDPWMGVLCQMKKTARGRPRKRRNTYKSR